MHVKYFRTDMATDSGNKHKGWKHVYSHTEARKDRKGKKYSKHSKISNKY